MQLGGGGEMKRLKGVEERDHVLEDEEIAPFPAQDCPSAPGEKQDSSRPLKARFSYSLANIIVLKRLITPGYLYLWLLSRVPRYVLLGKCS